MKTLLLTVTLLGAVCGDVYLHMPRGSNNRLNERTANRKNGNRLFDSQNNNKGGYNVGDVGVGPSFGNENQQYRMKYFQSSAASLTNGNGAGDSYLTIEWTNQHGCGGGDNNDVYKPNCNIVLQYMCQDDADTPTGTRATKSTTLRNGVDTNTQNFQNPSRNENQQRFNNRRNQVNERRGLHESFENYNDCYLRERNAGLFTADQNLKRNNQGYSSAIHTRQNPNGNRRGYECPEERDYYPYWHPTAWKDIAVLAENQDICTHYQTKSFNVQPYHACVEWFDAGKNSRKASRYNNKQDCEGNNRNGVWTEFSNYLEKAPQHTSQASCEGTRNGVRYIWAIPHDSTNGRTPECLVALSQPFCSAAPWSRSNHLGNGMGGQPNNFTWTLPHFPSGKQQRCVFRTRYNISTGDYEPFNTDASSNKKNGVISPVQQNPNVQIAPRASVRLAINTAQFGRTFQDRSHVFILRSRPDGTDQQKIYNLNVRGKRGNIVQTFPAVEYDFFPNPLNIGENDLVHVQWTGSNSHNNKNDGDAGEGQGGTDRSNIVQIRDLDENYPMPMEEATMWKNAQVRWIYHGQNNIKPEDLSINMASAGFYMCLNAAGCPNTSQSAQYKNPMNNLLNNVPASYEGVMVQFKKGDYHYMCTRNNNFSNRSQKASIIVQ